MNRRAFLTSAAAAATAGVFGCETTTSAPPTPQQSSAKRREIDASVDAALTRLYDQVRGSRELVQKSEGAVIFPSVFKAAVGIGGEYGEGALRVGGRTVDYYSLAAGSLGFQLGAQTKSVYILFMTRDALNQFRAGSGWQGADASVALMNVGAAGTISTETVKDPVVGLVLTEGGLMFDASLAGTKITKLQT
jgi:lipid-binding SYLF domain-containing protein